MERGLWVCPATPLHALSTSRASTDHGCPWGTCVQSCTGTQESLPVWSGHRMPRYLPPTPPQAAPYRIKLPYWK